MAIAIALGAFGAHGLKGKISKQMFENWDNRSPLSHYSRTGSVIYWIIDPQSQSSYLSSLSLRLVDIDWHSTILRLSLCDGAYQHQNLRSHYSLRRIFLYYRLAPIAYSAWKSLS